jgi:hypothetical protein
MKNEMDETGRTHGRNMKYKYLKGNDQLEDLNVDVGVILKHPN